VSEARDREIAEALAHGRRDLVSAEDRERAEADLGLATRIAETKDGSRELGVALRRAVPTGEVDDLVAAAMAHADVPVASRRSLVLGAVLGTITLSVSAVLALLLDGGVALERAASLGRAGVTAVDAVEHAVLSVPGGLNTISIALAAILGCVAIGIRLVGRARVGVAIVPFVLVAALGNGTAHAYELEGTCGSTPVSISIERAPRSVALRQALASGGLGIAYALPDDPPVSLHVGRAPLSNVLSAILGAAPVRVRCAGAVVAFEPASASTVTPAGLPTLAIAPAMPGSLRDVITWGGPAFVSAADEARDVVTAGGDAVIVGRAYGNVLTMGGDAEIRGVVVGDVFTMGGDIRVAPEGSVHGRLEAMGGEIHDGRAMRPAPWTTPVPLAVPAPAAMACDPEVGSAVADFLGSGARHALLFLVGLLILALAPGRLRAIGHVLVDRPIRATAMGMLSMFGLPLLCVALCITVIGIPAAAVVGFLGVVALVAGLVAASMVIGAAIPSRTLSGRPVAQLAAGTLALFLVSQIPVLGWIAWLVALFAGFGAIVLTRAGARET
jgi:hypothetical protein